MAHYIIIFIEATISIWFELLLLIMFILFNYSIISNLALFISYNRLLLCIKEIIEPLEYTFYSIFVKKCAIFLRLTRYSRPLATSMFLN